METVQRTSFHPINTDPEAIHINLLDQQCARLVNTKEPLQITRSEQNYSHLPYALRLICSFYHSLSNSTPYSYIELQQSRNLPQNSTASNNPLTHNIKYPLFKLILTGLQKKLFLSEPQQKFYEEISYSLAFKSNLVPYFLAILSENTNYVPLERVTSIYRALTSEQYLLYLPIQLYFLFGGSLFTIEAKSFKEKIANLVQNIAKALSHSDTFISRNIEFFKNNKQRKLILDQSLKIVILAKNKDNLQETANSIATSLFAGKEYLSKQEFLHHLQSKPLNPTLTIFLLLLRSEFTLFQEKTFQQHLTARSEVNKTNFYTHEMTKLFNKCPFNGDQRCNCKKCQCVRRNRQSAKLNQQKKRNAVEQVDSMKQRIDQLQTRQKSFERKIGELQEENMMLKTILNQIKHNHNMKSSLLETIEPISKILNNEL